MERRSVARGCPAARRSEQHTRSPKAPLRPLLSERAPRPAARYAGARRWEPDRTPAANAEMQNHGAKQREARLGAQP